MRIEHLNTLVNTQIQSMSRVFYSRVGRLPETHRAREITPFANELTVRRLRFESEELHFAEDEVHRLVMKYFMTTWEECKIYRVMCYTECINN